jgi:hypothetical protein
MGWLSPLLTTVLTCRAGSSSCTGMLSAWRCLTTSAWPEEGQGGEQAVTAATIPGDGPSVFHRDLHLNDRARRAARGAGEWAGGYGAG